MVWLIVLTYWITNKNSINIIKLYGYYWYRMSELVFLSEELKDRIKVLYPKKVSIEYYDAYLDMIKANVLENKKDHCISKLKIKGFEGYHDIIHGCFTDALMVREEFVKIFGGK